MLFLIFSLVTALFIVGIDSSGEPEKPKEFIEMDQSSLFVVSAVITHENYYFGFKNKFEKLVQNSFGKNIEVHMKELTNLNKMRNQGVSFNDIKDFLDKLYKLIGESELTLIGVIINKYPPSSKIGKKKYRKNLLQTATQLLLERITKYFDKIGLQNRKEFALLLIDESYYREDMILRDIVKEELEKGIYTSTRISKDRVISEPLFYNSKKQILIQVADAVAFCIRRKFTKPVKSGLDFSIYFDEIKKRFDTCLGGIINGCGIKTWWFNGT